MIRYALTCGDGHTFESWFQSSDAFETLRDRGLVVCEHCGSADVQKSLMAPGVSAAMADPVPEGDGKALATGPLTQERTKMAQMLREMRAHLEKNSTYVGQDFAREARDMHLGDTPERQIHGEASADEARALVEDGVPILPIPKFGPEKAN